MSTTETFNAVAPAPVVVCPAWATKVAVKSVSYPTPYFRNSAATIPPRESTLLTFKIDPVPAPFLMAYS